MSRSEIDEAVKVLDRERYVNSWHWEWAGKTFGLPLFWLHRLAGWYTSKPLARTLYRLESFGIFLAVAALSITIWELRQAQADRKVERELRSATLFAMASEQLALERERILKKYGGSLDDDWCPDEDPLGAAISTYWWEFRPENRSAAREMMESAVRINASLLGIGAKCTYLSDASLDGADLRAADFESAVLNNSRLRKADLSFVKVDESLIRKTNLHRAWLREAYMNERI